MFFLETQRHPFPRNDLSNLLMRAVSWDYASSNTDSTFQMYCKTVQILIHYTFVRIFKLQSYLFFKFRFYCNYHIKQQMAGVLQNICRIKIMGRIKQESSYKFPEENTEAQNILLCGLQRAQDT